MLMPVCKAKRGFDYALLGLPLPQTKERQSGGCALRQTDEGLGRVERLLVAGCRSIQLRLDRGCSH